MAPSPLATLGIVFVDNRRTEDGHDLVADEFVDGVTYLRRDQIEPIADRIFHLDVGGISAPIPKLHNQEKRHVVLKILDEIPVPFEVAAPAVHKALIGRKKEHQLKAVIDSLKASYALQIHHGGIAVRRRNSGEEPKYTHDHHSH